LVASLAHLSLQKNELKLVPSLQLIDGRFCVITEASRDRRLQSGRRGSRKSSRRSSRRSSQQHGVSKDVDVSITSDVIEGDSLDVTTAGAATEATTARTDNGLYCYRLSGVPVGASEVFVSASEVF